VASSAARPHKAIHPARDVVDIESLMFGIDGFMRNAIAQSYRVNVTLLGIEV
jgi:hypothetical protein